MKTKRMLREELLRYRRDLLAIVLFQLTVIGMATIMPKISGWFLDSLVNSDMKKSKELIITFIAVSALYEIAQYFKTVIGGGYKERVSANLIERIILHLQKISLLQLENRDRIALSRQISMDASMSVALVTDFFMAFAYSNLVIIIVIVNLALINWFMLIPLLIFAITYVISYLRYKEKISDSTTSFVEAQNDFFSKQTEQLEKAKTIRGNGAEEFIYGRTLKALEHLVATCKRAYKNSSSYTMINNIICKLSIVGMWTMAVALVGNDRITLGTFITVSAFYEMAISETHSLSETIVYMRQTFTSLQRLEDLVSIEKENEETIILQQVDDIKITHLSFGYSGLNLINNLNIEMHKGNIYLLKGDNGKGKSTLLNLISGLYSEYQGSILYDGRDLRQIKKKNIIGIVEQEPLVISGTIKENLLLGNKNNVSDVEIINWLKRFKLDKLCNRLDEVADGLSGGEKQKLVIIRTLLRNPDVLFLDEVTSALDVESKEIVKDELERIKKNKIIVLIEHGNAMDGIVDKFIAI